MDNSSKLAIALITVITTVCMSLPAYAVYKSWDKFCSEPNAPGNYLIQPYCKK